MLKRLMGILRPLARKDEATEQGEDIVDPFLVPDNPRDEAGWDQYWQRQVSAKVVRFIDIFVRDEELIDAMGAYQMGRVLCAGSGLSLEPFALAAAGLEVTAIDLSPWAIEIMRDQDPDLEELNTRYGEEGRALGAPTKVQWVHGDILDPSVCTGPYDLIIERRTAQLYDDRARPELLAALADRLTTEGILYSHCHAGWWRPPDPVPHVNREWFEAAGWPIWARAGDERPVTRVAWLFTSTG